MSVEAPLGMGCYHDIDCASRDCPGGEPGILSICTHGCREDADCADGASTDAEAGLHEISVCGIALDGHRWCVPPCGHKESGFVCENGVSTSCEVAHDPDCNVCGCPLGMKCTSSGCFALADVGGPCETNEDCLNAHCLVSKKCGVETGSPCTADNCEICLTYDSWSFCNYAHSCGACGLGDTSVCINDTDPENEARIGACKPFCGSPEVPGGISCPGTCGQVVVDSKLRHYCHCEECEIAH